MAELRFLWKGLAGTRWSLLWSWVLSSSAFRCIVIFLCSDFNFRWGPSNRTRSHSANPIFQHSIIPSFHCIGWRQGRYCLPCLYIWIHLDLILSLLLTIKFGARTRLTVRCRKGWKWSTAWDVLAPLFIIKGQGITFKGDINQNIFQNCCSLFANIGVALLCGGTCLCSTKRQPHNAILYQGSKNPDKGSLPLPPDNLLLWFSIHTRKICYSQ